MSGQMGLFVLAAVVVTVAVTALLTWVLWRLNAPGRGRGD